MFIISLYHISASTIIWSKSIRYSSIDFDFIYDTNVYSSDSFDILSLCLYKYNKQSANCNPYSVLELDIFILLPSNNLNLSIVSIPTFIYLGASTSENILCHSFIDLLNWDCSSWIICTSLEFHLHLCFSTILDNWIKKVTLGDIISDNFLSL